jgi:type IV pilus assembly protein PilB
MPLNPGRPVPEASSEKQQRLEVELLVGEPVLQALELQGLGQELILAGKGLPTARWREIGAMPIQEVNGRLVVAVPSNWGDQQRQDLNDELQRVGFSAELKLALATNLTAALTGRPQTAPAPSTKSSQLLPTGSFNAPRSLIKHLEIPGTSEGQMKEVTDIEDLEMNTAAANNSTNGSPVVSLVDRILIEALSSGASDIHVEPQENTLGIRFRQDGVLQKHFEDLPKSLTPAVTSRIKIMAELDIAERRLPQDGRIRRMFRGRKMDIRVSTLPSRNGEKLCLRLLDSSATQLGLETLITDADTRITLQELGSKPYGMILVTGPTGSGKSTTLYALLAERNDPSINISTVEDPIEYTLPGITQTQVNREKGLDFSTALRAFMRQDPDVLLVGETRDLETAKTAVEAALTGHLVMTTLHCNDTASAIARLDEMGVEPFMVSASLLGIISQRLVRRVCTNCRISYKPSHEELGRFGLLSSHETDVTFFGANTQDTNKYGWCQACNGSGYKGRVGVYEILKMNDTIAAAVAKKASTDVIRRMALENGMKTLLGYGLQLVREGITTLAEVERILLTDSGLESERRSRSLSTLTCSCCGGGLQDEWLECPYCLTSR